MEEGSIVRPVNSDTEPLRSGGEYYTHAIVVRVNPLVLVSEDTDMRWQSTIQDRSFVVIGKAPADVLERCKQRL